MEGRVVAGGAAGGDGPGGASPPADSADGPARTDTAGGYQVVHSSRVLLVEGRGRVRGAYEILRPEAFPELVRDARRLARQGAPSGG